MRTSHLIPALLLPWTLIAHEPVVVFAHALDELPARDAVPRLRAIGFDVAVVVSPGVYYGWCLDRHALENAPMVEQVVGMVEARTLRDREEGEVHLALRYLAHLGEGHFDLSGTREAMDWSGHTCAGEPRRDEGGLRSGGEDHGDDWACGHRANSERLVGVVAASTFFVESDGSTDADLHSWTPAAIDEVKLAVIDAWAIWSYTALQRGIALTAVMDWYEPGAGITEQGHEPVLHPSSDDHLWIDAIMDNLGTEGASTNDRVHRHNHARMPQLGTDHAFSTFVAYNPPASGAPTQLTDGSIAYAVLGGPYIQLLYKANGWSVAQLNRVYGHEVGHIFHAFDEYAGSGSANCARTFNGRQNLNFQGAPCAGAEACVMVDNSFLGSGGLRQWNMCSHTPVHLGWTGTLPPPVPTFPINDTLLHTASLTCTWAPGTIPPGLEAWIRIEDRITKETLICTPVPAEAGSWTVQLPNGLFAWEVGHGRLLTTNGYAGMVGAMGFFQVDAPLAAAFTVEEDTLCPGAAAIFTATASGAISGWNWNFPGGVPDTYAGPTPPPVVYGDPGPHDVTLVVSDGMAADTLTIIGAVFVEPLRSLPFTEHWMSASLGEDWSTTVPDSALHWTIDTVTSAAPGHSAVVHSFDRSGPWRAVRLCSPLFDLSAATQPYLRFRYAYAQASPAVTEVLMVDAVSCEGDVTEHLFEEGGGGLATNGGAWMTGQPWVPQAGDWREVLLPVPTTVGTQVRFHFDLLTLGGQDLRVDAIELFDAAELPLRMWLGGPYVAAEGLMHDGLRTGGYVPLQEPYTAAGYVYPAPLQGTLLPAVLATSGPGAVVDWVLVELRAPATPAQVLHARAALLQRDGDVVGLDGISPLRFPIPADTFLVAVKHRNHLGAMSLDPVAVGPGGQVLDLTATTTPTWGTNARYLVDGQAVLWPGDLNRNRSVSYIGNNNDRDPILQRVGGGTPNNIVTGYWPEDFDLDGRVMYNGPGNDRDGILMTLGGNALGIRHQQVP